MCAASVNGNVRRHGSQQRYLFKSLPVVADALTESSAWLDIINVRSRGRRKHASGELVLEAFSCQPPRGVKVVDRRSAYIGGTHEPEDA